MNTWALIGILCVVYAAVLVWMAIKQPKAIWEMGKIKLFRKSLGEKGTVIMFYTLAVAFAVLGIWLIMK